jgi:hypothetical protein
MHIDRLISKAQLLLIPALLFCAFSFLASGANGKTRDAASGESYCPFASASVDAGDGHQKAASGGKVVPSGPLRLQLCRYYVRDGETRLAPARMYPSKAVARSFARRFNRLPQPPPARQCESQGGRIIAYFGYQRRVVPVTITLGGCRLVSGASRKALATPDLVSDLAELTSKGDVPLPGPDREVSTFSVR